MKILLITALLAASQISSTSSLSAQDTPTFRAGLKSFTIPQPAPDLVEAGADYRVILEPLAPTQNRLIAGFVQPADLDAVRSGAAAALGTYALVEVPRRAEFMNVTPDQFKEISDAIATQFGASVTATLKDQQDEINRRLKALHSSSGDVTLDNKPVQLGTLFSKPDACAYGMLMSVSSNGKTRKMVMAWLFFASRPVFFLRTPTRNIKTSPRCSGFAPQTNTGPTQFSNLTSNHVPDRWFAGRTLCRVTASTVPHH